MFSLVGAGGGSGNETALCVLKVIRMLVCSYASQLSGGYPPADSCTSCFLFGNLRVTDLATL